MYDDFIPVCFRFWNPDCLLWWLLLISFFGALSTGAMMVQINSFITDKDGHQVSLLKLEGMKNAEKLRQFFGRLMPVDLKLVRRSLLIDYAFMPCLYLLMWSITVLCQRHCIMGEGWVLILYYLCWVPFAVWLLDIAENTFTLFALSDYEKENAEISKTQVLLMSVSSCLKWLIGMGWALCMISLLTGYLVKQIGASY